MNSATIVCASAIRTRNSNASCASHRSGRVSIHKALSAVPAARPAARPAHIRYPVRHETPSSPRKLWNVTAEFTEISPSSAGISTRPSANMSGRSRAEPPRPSFSTRGQPFSSRATILAAANSTRPVVWIMAVAANRSLTTQPPHRHSDTLCDQWPSKQQKINQGGHRVAR